MNTGFAGSKDGFVLFAYLMAAIVLLVSYLLGCFNGSVMVSHFVIFCNDARLFHFSYQRYLENQIRETFGLDGTPVRFLVRERDRNDTD